MNGYQITAAIHPIEESVTHTAKALVLNAHTLQVHGGFLTEILLRPPENYLFLLSNKRFWIKVSKQKVNLILKKAALCRWRQTVRI